MLPHALKNLSFVERFYSYPVLASTSDTARALGEFPQEGLYVIQADRQTAGRGRSGAPFFSNVEGGLWASIVQPVTSFDEHFAHNRALSIALCKAVESFCGRPAACTIKWPNDIYWGGRKLCGILLENHSGRQNMLIIGFGINVNLSAGDFPQELRDTATSVFMETGQKLSLSRLLNDIILQYHANLTLAVHDIHELYTRRLHGVGRTVEIEGKTGIFEGVEPDGRLRLRQEQEVLYMVSGHLKFLP
jgi:BirA family biotin operon repressor/biotin-[acetyl-CoA-carboxylase] ligase